MSIKNNLGCSNATFYDYIFPTKEYILYSPKVDYETNDIQFVSGIVYGAIGSGKSCIGISITDEAVKKYGIEEVNSAIEPYGDLEKTIKYGIRKSLVNILFTDDVTLRPISRSTLRLFFQIRHLYKNAFNVKNGYILALLGIHRFHASVPELRTNIDFLVVKTLPSNDYDFNVIKRRIGEKGVKLLMNIEKKKLKSPAYKKYSLYWLRTGEKGLLTTELPQSNYMRVI